MAQRQGENREFGHLTRISPESRARGGVLEPPYARFTLADPMPRLCPDAVGSANVNGLPTRNRPSGPHREALGRSSGNIKHV